MVEVTEKQLELQASSIMQKSTEGRRAAVNIVKICPVGTLQQKF